MQVASATHSDIDKDFHFIGSTLALYASPKGARVCSTSVTTTAYSSKFVHSTPVMLGTMPTQSCVGEDRKFAKHEIEII